MTEELKKKINEQYQKGGCSIQDIARWNRCTVDEILIAIGQKEMLTVTTAGDQIGQDEAGFDVAVSPSKTFKITYTTD